MKPRVVVWIGCVVLAATAAFPASGWSGVAEAVDALLLLLSIGPFVGEALLVFAAVCFAVGAARLRPASGG